MEETAVQLNPIGPSPSLSEATLKNEDLLSAILWLLGLATVFLLTTAVALAMARDGLVLWDQATSAVQALSTICTMMVAVVAIVHLKSGRPDKG
jgi:hypothetical protein